MNSLCNKLPYSKLDCSNSLPQQVYSVNYGVKNRGRKYNT